MLYSEIIAVCSQIHINTLCGLNVELLNVKPGGTYSDHWAVDCVWNVMAHAQKPHFVFRLNGRVHLNRRGSQFSRLLVAEVCASAVVMLDTPCCGVVWRVLATHSTRQFPLHFPSRASPCAITFQLATTYSDPWPRNGYHSTSHFR
jgi:hypothetical protein